MNLMLMLVLSLMCYFFAGGYLKRKKIKNYNAALLQKTLASACFVGIGAFSLSMSWYEKFAQLVFLGLCCGAVGDVLMAVAKNKNRKLTVRSASFGVGMLVFLAGHVLYILGLADITFDVFKVGIPYAVAAVLLSLLFEKKQKRVLPRHAAVCHRRSLLRSERCDSYFQLLRSLSFPQQGYFPYLFLLLRPDPDRLFPYSAHRID